MTRLVTRHPALALAILGALTAAIWMLALPEAARRSAFEQRWRRTERAGIDPGAFNYRELPLVEDLYAELCAKRAARPEVWIWGQTTSTSARDRNE